jgi:hypothetical protein
MMRFESRHSQVLNLLGDANSVLRHKVRAAVNRASHVAPAKPLISEPGLDDAIYRPPANATWRDAWRVTEAEITMIQHDVVAHHARLLVVTLANGIQDDPDPVGRAHYQHFAGAGDLFYPDRRIRALGDREGFAVLNVAPPMQRYAEEHHEDLHGFANTRLGIGHWNAEGHRLAGELIGARLIEMLRDSPGP